MVVSHRDAVRSLTSTPEHSRVRPSHRLNWFGALAAATFAFAAQQSSAADWRYSVGIHDFIVDQVNSDTYGLDAGVFMSNQTAWGVPLVGSFQLSWDHDQDDLDPDHIPIWWQLHLGSGGVFWQPSPRFDLGWTADLNTRMNTVSSIERQIQLLPTLSAAYHGSIAEASVKAGGGYFFLEIDDDVPSERGYVREDLRTSTFAESLVADGSIKLGESWKLKARAQGWWDGSDWLQTEYAAEVHFAVNHSANTEMVLSAEVNEYNLDIYRSDQPLPLLPWDRDLLLKLLVVMDW
ncbi:MAG: hypothetical protein ACJ8MH_13455 [Povalibacter sp.]